MIVEILDPTEEERADRIVHMRFIPENIEELLSCVESELQRNGNKLSPVRR